REPVPPVPDAWRDLAARLAADAARAPGTDTALAPSDEPSVAAIDARTGVACDAPFRPDICLINWYGADGRMGLHQDKDESPASIASGRPVVSVSIGDSARFLFGGTR